jgi:hypothetical protein
MALALVLSLAGVSLNAADSQASALSADAQRTLAHLRARQARQEAASRGRSAFYNFRFTDRIRESGITFEHRIVEDAAKFYKAAHYDHGNGMAAADVDGDGLPDLYFTTQVGSNQLWRNLGNGRFEDITGMAGVGMTNQISVAAAFADIDNDGDPDLFVTTVRHGNRLFENQGGGRFRDITREAGVEYSGHSSGALFFDMDGDGLLDLFVANVGVYTGNRRHPSGAWEALTDAFHGHLFPERSERSLLYRNLGARRFKEVGAEMGITNVMWSGDAAFGDVNADGFPDLYVVNMQGDDTLYENRGGRGFVDRTDAWFPRTPWGAMGAKFFDFDQDGALDLFVTDMHSDMTRPQTELAFGFQVAIEKSKSEAWCSAQWPESFFQGSSNNVFGNAFYRNLGGRKFLEVSDSLGVETYWPWGFSVGDLNGDGFEDIVISAGMGYPFRYAINSVLLNETGRRFMDAEFLLGVEPRAGGRIEKPWFTLDCGGADRGHAACEGFTGVTNISGTLSSRSSVVLDLEGDGDLDIVFHEFNDRPQLLVSDLASRGGARALQVRLQGTASNRDGLGALVRARIGGRTWTRFHDGKSGYLGQSSMPLWFALPGDLQAEWVEVRWPSGRAQRVTKDIPRSGLMTIVER